MNHKPGYLASFFTVVLACAAIAQAQILPDDPGYRTIRQNEAAELRAADSSMEKAELSLLHAQRRFSEVRRAVEEEKLSLVRDLVRGYNGSLEQVLSEITREITRDTNVSEFATSLQQTLSGHIPELTDLADHSPREIRSTLRQALDTAHKAHGAAINWLERQERIDAGGVLPGTRAPASRAPTPETAPGSRPSGAPGGASGGRTR